MPTDPLQPADLRHGARRTARSDTSAARRPRSDVRWPMTAHYGSGRAIVVFDVVYRLPREICGAPRAGELVRGRVILHWYTRPSLDLRPVAPPSCTGSWGCPRPTSCVRCAQVKTRRAKYYRSKPSNGPRGLEG